MGKGRLFMLVADAFGVSPSNFTAAQGKLLHLLSAKDGHFIGFMGR